MIRHVVFDFFGTLATYTDGVLSGRCERSLRVLVDLGVTMPGDEFLRRWQATFDELESAAESGLREYSMVDAGKRFLASQGVHAEVDEVARFVSAYIDDWNVGVALLPKLDVWLAALPFGKSIVSNTHEADLVPNHLRAGGVESAFETITVSVAHGMRKPHPDIYASHLTRLGLDASEAAFVGDNLRCDYLGPRDAGMRAYLIAPSPVDGVPEAHRISHLFGLADRLADRLETSVCCTASEQK